MKIACKLFISIFVIAFSSAFANENKGFVVGYFNGVGNTPDQSSDSLRQLTLNIGSTYKNEPVAYEVFYNPTEGFLSDVAEAFAQKQRETPEIKDRWELMWEALAGVDFLTEALAQESGTGTQIMATLRTYFIALARQKTVALVNSQNFKPLVDGMTARVMSHYTEGKKFLGVAHSQGNLFINGTYTSSRPLMETDSFKVVHVASAAGTASGPYVTADIDLVINAVRLAIGETLPSNISIPVKAMYDTSDFSGHGFTSIYMNPKYPAYQQIMKHIKHALDTLETPKTKGSEGAFTLTLIWDGLGDVDLHVTEPNGTKVYYGNKEGSSGYLDVDNTYGYGPEHYYATKTFKKLQEGNYTVDVNNFCGSEERVATVQFSSDSLISKPYRVDMCEGDYQSVFSIKVIKDHKNKKFKFKILDTNS